MTIFICNTGEIGPRW